MTMQQSQWAPSVILVDADFLDNTAFDFIVNFERMIGRHIPEGDLCHWLDCIALDGGLLPGENEIQVHFLHSKSHKAFKCFTPSDFKADVNDLPFKDNLGHFSLFAFPVEEVVSLDDFFVQSMTMLADAKEIDNLMVVGNLDRYGDRIRQVCSKTDGKTITLFSMQSMNGAGFKHENLGYSLMSALGIKSEELR